MTHFQFSFIFGSKNGTVLRCWAIGPSKTRCLSVPRCLEVSVRSICLATKSQSWWFRHPAEMCVFQNFQVGRPFEKTTSTGFYGDVGILWSHFPGKFWNPAGVMLGIFASVWDVLCETFSKPKVQLFQPFLFGPCRNLWFWRRDRLQTTWDDPPQMEVEPGRYLKPFLGLRRALGTRFYIRLSMKQFALEFLQGWYLGLGLRLILSGSKCFAEKLKNSNCEVDFFSMLFDPWFRCNFRVYDESSWLLQ